MTDAMTSRWAKSSGGPSGDETQNLVAHALTGEGHDASEDGTGRGTPLVVDDEHDADDGVGLLGLEASSSRDSFIGIGQRDDFNAVGADHELHADQPDMPAPDVKQVAAPLSHGSNPNSNMAGRRREDDENLVAHALLNPGQGGAQGHDAVNLVTREAVVRRLTPTECERLQAFPDDWTDLGPDSRRYAALGDAVTVNVAEWIGRRILEAA